MLTSAYYDERAQQADPVVEQRTHATGSLTLEERLEIALGTSADNNKCELTWFVVAVSLFRKAAGAKRERERERSKNNKRHLRWMG